MRLRPEVAEFLSLQSPFPTEALSDPAASTALLRRLRATHPPQSGDAMTEVRDVALAEADVRVYRPTAAENVPVVLFIHGGGWVIGDLDSHDPLCRRVAARSGCVVVSVGYRLAPGNPYPAAVVDCVAALDWTLAHITEWGGDPNRLATLGVSAGGALAAALALRARDSGASAIAIQVLVYPALDATMSTQSYRDFSVGYFLERDQMAWAWSLYLGDTDAGGDPLASPAAAASLSGLPRTLTITAEFDPLRDEAETWTDRLLADGVPARAVRFHGQIHGFLAFLDAWPDADAAVDEIVEELRALGSPT